MQKLNERPVALYFTLSSIAPRSTADSVFNLQFKIYIRYLLVRRRCGAVCGGRSDPSSTSSCPFRQICRQCHAKVRIGSKAQVVDVLLAAAALQLSEIALNLVEVSLAKRARIGQQLRELLQTAKKRCFLEREIQFCTVQDMKNQDFVALVAKVLEPRQQIPNLVKQVAHNNQHRSPRYTLGQLVENRRQPGLFPGGAKIHPFDYLFQMRGLGRGTEKRAQLVIESHQPGAILLMKNQVGQRCRQHA